VAVTFFAAAAGWIEFGALGGSQTSAEMQFIDAVDLAFRLAEMRQQPYYVSEHAGEWAPSFTKPSDTEEIFTVRPRPSGHTLVG
jgi:hypothetical protein